MNEDHKHFKTAIYIRVSTDDQVENGHSLDGQLAEIKDFCKYKKLDIVKIYKDDGKSAKNMNGRPKFLEMIKDIKDGKINNICIHKLDRLTRSVKDLEEILVLLEEYQCGLMSVREEINTKGYMGVFFIRLTILLAQLEIDQTRERTIFGLNETVKQGIPIGKLPLGYVRDENNKDEKSKKKAIINEEEAKTVRRIFNLYLNGYSFYGIANILKEEQNDLMKWKDSVVQNIINNRLYCGDIEHRKTIKDKPTKMIENVVPPIISKEVFNECQTLIEKNKKSFGGTLNYMFGKTLYCDKCKTLLKVSTAKDKGIKHYVCNNCKNFNETKVEKEVLDKISNLAEFNMALTYNAIMVDNDRLTEILNNVEIVAPDERLKEHKEELRMLLDDIIIGSKKEQPIKIWTELDYEEKRDFIRNNIEAIYIEKIKGNSQQDYKVKVKSIKFKTSRMNTFFDLINKGVIDSVFSNGKRLFSMAVEKDKKYVDNYVKRLKNRYNINVEEEVIRRDAFKYKSNTEDNDRRMNKLDNEKLFKVIKMPSSRKNDLRDKLAKERYIYVSLDKN